MVAMVWPMVSVVVLNFNGKKLLGKCLDSVLKSDYPNFEVVFVDNASTDGSVEFVRSNFGQYSNLRIMRNDGNFGFAEGNNIGARVARGKYVAFLNNDTEVDPEWLKELAKVMESDGTIGAAQSKLLLFDRKTIDSAGDFINSYGKGWMRGHGEEDEGQYGRTDEIFSARGAAMIIRKQILREVGYFDSTFFMVFEDVDLCWKVRLNGYKVLFVPKSIVYHFGSSIRKETQDIGKGYFYSIRNSLAALIKNYDLQNLLIGGAVNVLFEFTHFLMSLPFPSKKRYTLSRLSALLWNLFNFRCLWKKRLKVQYYVRKIPDDQIKGLMIKGNSPFLDVIWNLFYKNSVDYTRFINQQVYLKNKWVS
jgi:GT2 family glycosyltransferase